MNIMLIGIVEVRGLDQQKQETSKHPDHFSVTDPLKLQGRESDTIIGLRVRNLSRKAHVASKVSGSIVCHKWITARLPSKFIGNALYTKNPEGSHST